MDIIIGIQSKIYYAILVFSYLLEKVKNNKVYVFLGAQICLIQTIL